MPVLIGATGGTERHSLVLEHALRPLFSYLRADGLARRACTPPPTTSAPSSDEGTLEERVDRAGADFARLLSSCGQRIRRSAFDEEAARMERLLTGPRHRLVCGLAGFSPLSERRRIGGTAPAHPAGRPADRAARAAADRRAADRPAGHGPAPDPAADRADGADRDQLRPAVLVAAGVGVRPRRAAARGRRPAAGAVPGLLPAGGGPAAAPRRGAVLARPRRPQALAARGGRLGRGQRGVPPGHPRRCCAPRGRCRPPSSPTPASAPGARPAGPTTRTSSRCCGSCSSATRWRSPESGGPGAREAVGPRRARVRRRPAARPRRGAGRARRTPAARAGHRPPDGTARPRRADVRARSRRAGRHRGRARQVAGRAVVARRASTSSRAGPRCCRRSTGW